MARLKRPLDRQAVKEADDKIYDKHRTDPRPNALFDAKGNRRPLNPNDPAQANLRREWVASYNESLASTEAANKHPAQATPPTTPAASTERPVSSAVQPCPLKHWIRIQVVPRPDLKQRPAYWAPVGSNPYVTEAFTAQITDGHHDGELDGGASVRFDRIPAGSCQVTLQEFFKPVKELFNQ